jgi:hypothetical protein
MDTTALLVFAIMGFIIITAINAIGFKISCRFFNRDVSYLEAIGLLIMATINSVIYTLIISIPAFFAIIYFSPEYTTLFKTIPSIFGLIGYIKTIKKHIEVSWINAILIHILGSIINALIIVGIVVILYIISWWFGGMEHIAGNIVSSQIPSNIGTIDR